MRWPWMRRESEALARDPEYTSGEAPFEWEAPDAVAEETPDAEPEEQDAPDDPLAELDGDTRALVEQAWAKREEQQRAAWREQGYDVSRDGRLLIADYGKVAESAGLPLSRPQPTAQTAAQAPPPAPQAPAADDPPPELDPMTATAEDYRRLTQWEIRQALRPMLEENQRLTGLLQRRAESDAMQRVRSTVEQYLPEMAPALDHPDFESAYRQQIASVGAEYLEDPVAVAQIAALVRARLDPARMPVTRDAQGRFSNREQEVERMRNQANRAAVQSTPPARGGAVARTPAADPQVELGARFLQHFHNQMPPETKKGAAGTLSERDRWELAEYNNIEDWKKAKAVLEAGNGRRR